MKNYIQPILHTECLSPEASILVGKQSKPANEQGGPDIFSNRGGFDDELQDHYLGRPGGLWDEEDQD